MSLLRRHGLLLGMVVFTAANLAVVLYRAERPAAAEVSALERPATIAGLSAVPADADQGPATACRVLVVFDPGCPACAEAAETHGVRSEPPPIPVTWVGETDADAAGFSERHPGLHVTAWPGIVDLLQVYAVPAAFLVQGETVLRSWRYAGSESLDDLPADCARQEVGGLHAAGSREFATAVGAGA